MQKERTLTNLLDLDKPVYLVFRNRAVFGLFLKQATKEGFEVNAEMPYHSYLKMNNDMSFQGVCGMAGHMKAYNDRTNIYAIDFARYINNCDDYIAQKGYPGNWK